MSYGNCETSCKCWNCNHEWKQMVGWDFEESWDSYSTWPVTEVLCPECGEKLDGDDMEEVE